METKNQIIYLRRAILWFAVVLLLPVAACRNERKVDAGNIDSRSTPTMRTTNVNTLISDSGIVQYHIVTPL